MGSVDLWWRLLAHQVKPNNRAMTVAMEGISTTRSADSCNSVSFGYIRAAIISSFRNV